MAIMKTAPLPLLLALAACTGAPGAGTAGATGVPITDVEGEPRNCAMTVRFGSYAMGIDRGAADRIERLLSGDRTVTSISRHSWGREGEYTLCVRTASPGDAAILFARIRPLLPAEPRGPIQVILADGTSYAAPAR